MCKILINPYLMLGILFFFAFLFSLVSADRSKKLAEHIPFDDTDDEEHGIRSGLWIHTDYRTGMQYLSTSAGGLIPRLDRFGKHMNVDDKDLE